MSNDDATAAVNVAAVKITVNETFHTFLGLQ